MSLFGRIMGDIIVQNVVDTAADIQAKSANQNSARVNNNADRYDDDQTHTEWRKSVKGKKRAEEEVEVLKKIVREISIDRRALLNTIKYLGEKWGQPASKEIIQPIRDAEVKKLENDPEHMKKVDEYIEADVKYRVYYNKR